MLAGAVARCLVVLADHLAAGFVCTPALTPKLWMPKLIRGRIDRQTPWPPDCAAQGRRGRATSYPSVTPRAPPRARGTPAARARLEVLRRPRRARGTASRARPTVAGARAPASARPPGSPRTRGCRAPIPASRVLVRDRGTMLDRRRVVPCRQCGIGVRCPPPTPRPRTPPRASRRRHDDRSVLLGDAPRRTAGSGTNTTVPAGASTSSPPTVKRAAPRMTTYSSSCPGAGPLVVLADHALARGRRRPGVDAERLDAESRRSGVQPPLVASCGSSELVDAARRVYFSLTTASSARRARPGRSRSIPSTRTSSSRCPPSARAPRGGRPS